MKDMTITVFGNPDVPQDAMAVRLLSRLRVTFPQYPVSHLDPNENILPPEKGAWWIIDVAEGIKKVTVFRDLHSLESKRYLSVHDMDLSFTLHLLSKLHKLPKKFGIIAIPAHLIEEEAFEEVQRIISTSL
ncbi:MAG TPA: hypothetical protein VJ179_03680 [Patescibacteria group bacterium]|nr:hypothetical protein [Patescibacteria group bacterium]